MRHVETSRGESTGGSSISWQPGRGSPRTHRAAEAGWAPTLCQTSCVRAAQRPLVVGSGITSIIQTKELRPESFKNFSIVT